MAGGSEVATTSTERLMPCLFGAEVAVDELDHLASTLAHQRNDVDVRLDVAGDHAHEGGLPDAASREDAHTLPFADGEQAVDRLDADLHGLADGRAVHGVGVGAVDRVARIPLDGGAVIERVADRVNSAADQPFAHPDGELFAGRHYNASKADAIYVFVRHQLDRAALQANHLRQNRAMGVHHDVANIPNVADQPGRLNSHAGNLADLSLISVQVVEFYRPAIAHQVVSRPVAHLDAPPSAQNPELWSRSQGAPPLDPAIF